MLEVNATARIYDIINLLLQNPTETGLVFYKKSQWQLTIPRWNFGAITVDSLIQDPTVIVTNPCESQFTNLIVQDSGDVPFAASDTIALILQRFPGYMNLKES